MEPYRIIVEDALEVLVGIADETGRDLSTVAQEVVETGCCPHGEDAGTVGY